MKKWSFFAPMMFAALVCAGLTFISCNVTSDGTSGGADPSDTTTYTVTYHDNGAESGSVPTDGTGYKAGETVTVLGNTGNLVKTGYSFSGWNTQSDGDGTTYSQGQTFEMGTAGMTLYAKWSPVESTLPAGEGTPESPYQIATAGNLIWLIQHSDNWVDNYIVIADIDISSTQYWDDADDNTDGDLYNDPNDFTSTGNNEGFKAVGNSTTKFTGQFNGNGFTIDGLTINRAGIDYLGLFGYIDSGATIQDLGVTNVSITLSDSPTFAYMGPIAGHNSGTISGSYATGSVSGGWHFVGGIAGINYGIISNCYSEADVSGGNYVGGITGSSWSSAGLISYSYSTGTVDCSNLAGGIAGSNAGTISDCYTSSTVDGSTRAGGAVGYLNNSAAVVNNVYSMGAVTGSSLSGGLIGDHSSGTVTNSFWDTETSGWETSASGTGKTSAEMKNVATFTDEATTGLDSAWDFVGNPNDDEADNDYWNIDAGVNNGYPYLSWQ